MTQTNVRKGQISGHQSSPINLPTLTNTAGLYTGIQLVNIQVCCYLSLLLYLLVAFLNSLCVIWYVCIVGARKGGEGIGWVLSFLICLAQMPNIGGTFSRDCSRPGQDCSECTVTNLQQGSWQECSANLFNPSSGVEQLHWRHNFHKCMFTFTFLQGKKGGGLAQV